MSCESSDLAKDQPAPLTSPSAIGASVNRRCHAEAINGESRRHYDVSMQKNVINTEYWWKRPRKQVIGHGEITKPN